MERWFLAKGNGHQIANRRKALSFVLENLEGTSLDSDGVINYPPYGRCHFASYTDQKGAMISTPDRDDNKFGSAQWHQLDRIMMFYDFGDGRCVVYVCPIKPLFEKRTIGYHGVRWDDVRKLAESYKVFKMP